MTETYARLVRVCDDRDRGQHTAVICGRLERMMAKGVHKSQRPLHRQPSEPPIRGERVVAIGAHGHNDIALFGNYAGTGWRANPETADVRYPSVIAVRWEPVIYKVDPRRVLEIVGTLPRSMKHVSKSEYEALRDIVVPRRK
jgi:hypothetical protein